jgi:hypothetical protein
MTWHAHERQVPPPISNDVPGATRQPRAPPLPESIMVYHSLVINDAGDVAWVIGGGCQCFGFGPVYGPVIQMTIHHSSNDETKVTKHGHRSSPHRPQCPHDAIVVAAAVAADDNADADANAVADHDGREWQNRIQRTTLGDPSLKNNNVETMTKTGFNASMNQRQNSLRSNALALVLVMDKSRVQHYRKALEAHHFYDKSRRIQALAVWLQY